MGFLERQEEQIKKTTMTIGIDCHHIKDQKGIERYLLNLLELWKKDKKINFILYLEKGDKSLKKIFKSDNFLIKELKNPFNISSTALFQHFTLPRAAKKNKIDLLFSPSYLLPIFYKGKTALTIHDIIYEAHPEWFNFQGWKDKILVKKIGKLSAKKADVILTPSRFTKKEIKKFYNISSSKIKTIPLAADESFQKAKNDQSIKKNYGIKKNFFLFSAALFQRRCVHESIFAFKKIAQDFPDYQYLIIGKDFTKLANIKELTNELNKKLKRKAFIYKPKFIETNELALVYKQAHAVIYLSLYEGFGLPVLEAMLAGTPVICGNADALSEIAQKNCFWVDNPRNISKIEKTLKESIEDSKKYQALKKNGLKRAQMFSWKKTSQKTLEIFKKLVNDN